jgi:1-deoxy-D-xylulose-5-phosphate reductoisomerase
VLIHPQSIVHSLVEYVDGSVIAQTLESRHARAESPTRWPTPERIASGRASARPRRREEPRVRAARPGALSCLGLARAALRAGGSGPAVLNAANEVAVEAFLSRRIRFTAIAAVIEDTLNGIAAAPAGALPEILEADALARRKARERIALREAA